MVGAGFGRPRRGDQGAQPSPSRTAGSGPAVPAVSAVLAVPGVTGPAAARKCQQWPPGVLHRPVAPRPPGARELESGWSRTGGPGRRGHGRRGHGRRGGVPGGPGAVGRGIVVIVEAAGCTVRRDEAGLPRRGRVARIAEFVAGGAFAWCHGPPGAGRPDRVVRRGVAGLRAVLAGGGRLHRLRKGLIAELVAGCVGTRGRGRGADPVGAIRRVGPLRPVGAVWRVVPVRPVGTV